MVPKRRSAAPSWARAVTRAANTLAEARRVGKLAGYATVQPDWSIVARRIREEAEKHDVPIVRDVPLARTLHSACKLGQAIPADLYEAVARLLAFVFSLKRGVA